MCVCVYVCIVKYNQNSSITIQCTRILLMIAMSVFVVVMTTASVENVVTMATWQHSTCINIHNIIQQVFFYNMNIAITQAAVLDMNIMLDGEVRNADAGMDHSLRFKYMV